MRRFIVVTAVVSAAAAGTPAVAQAHDAGSWKHKNHYLRAKMIGLGGDPGCDLVAKKCKKYAHLKGNKLGKKVRTYFNVMRQAIMPKPAVQYLNYGPPRRPPTGGETARATGAPLATIRQCESGGNYSTNTGNGFYGAYQFTQSTWESVGGSGNPAAASPAEQDKRAAMLYAQQGSSPWPVCGR